MTKKKPITLPANHDQRIKITKNGPYLVSGGAPLLEQIIAHDADGMPHSWREGKRFPLRERYALCRCGKSATMPFCDGSHRGAGFDGTETASRQPYLEEAKETAGPALTLTDAPSLCANAGFCDRAGGTWSLTEHSDDPKSRQIAIEEACDCPSGRLAAWDAEGNAIEPEFEPSIALVEDPERRQSGPLWVRGGIVIEGADGREYEARNRVTLCRCGKSKNKPFCDGSHSR
jgi:CDGSH-type Zn-finger protein